MIRSAQTAPRRIAAAAALAVILLLGACSQGPDNTQSSNRPTDDWFTLASTDPALENRRLGLPELVVVSPADGASVSSPVTVEIRVENYDLAAKGVSKDGEGHFHVVEGACIEPGEVIIDDHFHVGSGATAAEVELEPGTRELCVQLGDGFHTALAISQRLTVKVLG